MRADSAQPAVSDTFVPAHNATTTKTTTSLTFEQIRLRNFKSHADSSLRLANRGVCLIAGQVLDSASATSNGAGKTSLLPDGLLFPLYGRTLNGARGDDVVHRAVGRDCLVELTLRHGDTPLCIRRPVRHRTVKRVEVRVGSEVYRGTAEVDRIVREILGVSFETATAALVFGRGDTAFFTQRTDAERKAVLEELLGVGAVATFYQAACRRSQLLRAQAAAAATRRNALDAERVGVQHGLDALEEQRRVFATWYETERTKWQQEYTAAEQVSTALTAQQEATAQELATRCSVLPELDAAVDAAFGVAHKAQTDRITTEAEIRDLERQLNQVQATAERLQQVRGACPTCQQRVPPSHTAQVLDELARQERALLTTCEAARDAAAREAARTADAAQALAQAEQAAQAAHEVVDTLQQQLRTYADAVAPQTQHMATCRRRLQELDAMAVPGEAAIADMRQRVRTLEAQRRAAAAEAQTATEALAYTAFWETGFSQQGIKNMLLGNAMPFLNTRAAFYADQLTDGALHVEFSTVSTLKSGEQRDKIDVRVRAEAGGDSYAIVSDGQRRRADLIAAFALGDLAASRLATPIDLLVLDELFDGLDAAGIEHTIALLHQLGASRSSIFCTTHHPELAEHFSTVITVQNQHGVSTVVE